MDRTVDLPYDRTMEQPNNRTVKPAPPLMETTIFLGYEQVGLFITSHAAPLWPLQNTSSCDPPRHSLELLSNARAKNAGTKKPRRPESAGLSGAGWSGFEGPVVGLGGQAFQIDQGGDKAFPDRFGFQDKRHGLIGPDPAPYCGPLHLSHGLLGFPDG